MEQLAAFSESKYQLVYVDETGIDTYLYRPYARSLKGKPVKATISGRKYKRVSVVAAQIGTKLIAPMIYCNTMISALFEKWFTDSLLPSLTAHSVIIMDNASFHRIKVLQVLAQEFGHTVLPLSPYSPELNPIEKTWSNMKKYLREVLSNFCTFDETLESYFKVY